MNDLHIQVQRDIRRDVLNVLGKLSYKIFHPKDEVQEACILPIYLGKIYNEVNDTMIGLRWTGIVSTEIIKNNVQQA